MGHQINIPLSNLTNKLADACLPAFGMSDFLGTHGKAHRLGNMLGPGRKHTLPLEFYHLRSGRQLFCCAQTIVTV